MYMLLLPSSLQVLDMLIAVMVGGGVLGLAKLFPVSFWAFVGILVVSLVIMAILWTNHKRTVSVWRLHKMPDVIDMPRPTRESEGPCYGTSFTSSSRECLRHKVGIRHMYRRHS